MEYKLLIYIIYNNKNVIVILQRFFLQDIYSNLLYSSFIKDELPRLRHFL